jgi:hypothetical protein
MSNQTNSAPAGCRENAEGHWVPESLVDPVDAMRDELVMNYVRKAEELRRQLVRFKADAFEEMRAFHELSMAEYGVTPRKGVLGNTLRSYNGRYRIQISYNKFLEFDDRLLAAKELIDQCLDDWTSDGKDEVRSIVYRAFDVDQKGKVSADKVLSLRSIKSKDPRWQRAMDAISDSVTGVGSKAYLKIHKRIGDTDSWELINLSLAGVDV